jgi:hypothetical protein
MPKDKSVQYIPVFVSSVINEIISFVKWWYTEVPIWQIRLFKRVAMICDDSFSISMLSKTFFVPWHRDKSITGRIFGLLVRIIYLPVVISITMVLLSIIVAFILIWIALPGIFIFNFISSLPK